MVKKQQFRYEVKFGSAAYRDIKKLKNQSIKKELKDYLKQDELLVNPRFEGEELRKNLSPKWRYKVKQFRIVADINDSLKLITIIVIAHRKEVYEICERRF